MSVEWKRTDVRELQENYQVTLTTNQTQDLCYFPGSTLATFVSCLVQQNSS